MDAIGPWGLALDLSQADLEAFSSLLRAADSGAPDLHSLVFTAGFGLDHAELKPNDSNHDGVLVFLFVAIRGKNGSIEIRIVNLLDRGDVSALLGVVERALYDTQRALRREPCLEPRR